MTARAHMTVLIALLVGAGAAHAFELDLEVPNPTRGEPVLVTIRGVEAEGPFRLRATYRPGSQTEDSEEVGAFDDSGKIRWTPHDAGITRLSVSGPDGETRADRNVAVRFDSPPASGLAIFFFAGALLFGGATLAVRRALEGDGGGRPKRSEKGGKSRD